MVVRGTQALDRAFALLAAVVADGGGASLAAIAAGQALPLSTAHRMVRRMEASGLLVRVGRGRYHAGLGLARMAAGVEARSIAVAVARPLLAGLAARTGRVAHLGILEAEMVMYLVKEAPPPLRQGARDETFTREAMQLEAYCSAVGKMLLAGLPDAAQAAYLAQDNFVALTPRTIVQVAALRTHLRQVARQGFALDEEEIAAGLYCVAVPVAPVAGLPAMALSVAGAPPDGAARAAVLQALVAVAGRLAGRLRGGG